MGKSGVVSGVEGGYQMNSLTSADQEIPDWLVKIKFLGEAETAIRLDIKYWFGDVDLAQRTPFQPSYLFSYNSPFWA